VRKRKDGSQIVCLATRTFYTENSKKYRVSMVVDITKHKEQEELIAQQSKAVAMGEMIGNIAHQWRQPLNALSLYVSKLEQVFLNILNNSKDAFKERKIENKKVIISAKETKSEIIILFIDHAGGVDEKIINRLSEPYFSTKFANQGTGLGLYMSEMIIRNTFNGKLIMKNVGNGLETKIILEKK
jgi:C4-dicarboxylate-specific signal transduction histidine kinase